MRARRLPFDEKGKMVYSCCMEKIQIAVVYHKEATLVKNEDFLPVNAGRAVASIENLPWLKENTVGDDVGDNISAKNPAYNEMTAVYYLWKNVEADFYGLNHYRRFFVFKDTDKIYYSTKKIGDDFFDKIGYSPEKLRALLQEYDFIAPKAMKRKSVYEHYKNAHDASDLDEAGRITDEFYPEYSEAFKKYIFGQEAYFYNMFVFDKATFDRYCEFVFGVLEKLENRFEGKRMFVSERLTGVFITKLLLEGKKGLFLPTLYVESKPTFKQALKETKKNMKERKGGVKSILYAFKPLLVWLLPSFVFRMYRNRK